MKYGFYVSGNGTRLKLFLESELFQKKKNCQIGFVLIDNKNNKELEALCNSHNIPYFECSYKELNLIGKEQNRYISDRLLDLLNSTNSSYCFVFGGRILCGDLLKKYQYNLINFHPSLLPSYKGIRAIDQALAANALLLGNTAHFIDEELDAGPIIMQSIIPSKKFKDYDSVLNLQLPMISQIIDWLVQGRIKIVNNKVVIENATFELSTFIPNIESK